MLFFGVWDHRKGHFLVDKNGGSVRDEDTEIHDYELDGTFAPRVPGKHEPEDLMALVHLRGHTILAMWDRSVDIRGACNAAFIERGEWTQTDMMQMARRDFPVITARLKAFQILGGRP